MSFLRVRVLPLSFVCAVALAGAVLAGCGSSNTAATPTASPTVPTANGPKSIRVLSTNIPHTLNPARHPAVLTINLKVTGVALDIQDIGRLPRNGQGHVQVYLDRIPAAAYQRPYLKFPWLFLVASPSVNFRLPKTVAFARPGPHRFLLALAKNNDVLYRVPAASVSFILR